MSSMDRKDRERLRDWLLKDLEGRIPKLTGYDCEGAEHRNMSHMELINGHNDLREMLNDAMGLSDG